MSETVKEMEQVTAEEKKTTEKAKKSDKPAKQPKKSWFKGLKAEFAKVVWPSRKSLVRETIAVVVISVLLGVIISVVDFVTRIGIEFLVK